METQQNTETKKLSSAPQPNTTPIRVMKTLAKQIKALLLRLNKKTHGRKIRVDDVLAKALSLLEEKHLEELKENSLTNADKLEMQFQDYCKQHGAISKDEYLGRLMNGLAKS